MNRKGFTLIELLAVTIILALILVITIPTVLEVVQNTKESAMESDAKLIIDAINKKIAVDDTFNPLELNVDTIEEKLGIKNDNYESITVTMVDGKVNISIKGQGKWDGLTASGGFDSITVSESPSAAYYSIYPDASTVICNPDDITTGSCLGEISIFPYTLTSSNYKKCDGALLSIAGYSALYSLIGSNYGGDGRTVFALPNIVSPLTGVNYYMAVNGTSPDVSSFTPVESGVLNYISYQSTDRTYFTGEIRFATGIDEDNGIMLPCDGRLLSMTAYSALYSLIGGNYGGDGRSNFALPDLSSVPKPVSGGEYYIVVNGESPS